MRRHPVGLALLAAPLALGALAPPAAAQGAVKLAIVAEITGGGAPSGTMWRDGVILAAEEINKKGGILGRQLETTVMDTQSDPPTSVAVIRRAINERPFAIMGTVYSSSTVANMELARQAGVSARTVHYAGFTSLQVALTEQMQRLAHSHTTPARSKAKA